MAEDKDDAELVALVVALTAQIRELVAEMRGEPPEPPYGANVVHDGSIERYGVGGWNR